MVKSERLLLNTLKELESYPGWCDEVLTYAKFNKTMLYIDFERSTAAIDQAFNSRDMNLLENALVKFKETALEMYKLYSDSLVFESIRLVYEP